jgi:hypothetical protein
MGKASRKGEGGFFAIGAQKKSLEKEKEFPQRVGSDLGRRQMGKIVRGWDAGVNQGSAKAVGGMKQLLLVTGGEVVVNVVSEGRWGDVERLQPGEGCRPGGVRKGISQYLRVGGGTGRGMFLCDMRVKVGGGGVHKIRLIAMRAWMKASC